MQSPIPCSSRLNRLSNLHRSRDGSHYDSRGNDCPSCGTPPSRGACVVSLPDFLIIGAQKSGTTWLDRNLRLHPDLWLPPEKELHFFDFPALMPFFFLRLAPMRGIRHWARYRMQRDARLAEGSPELQAWYRRYYWWARTERWYQRSFSPVSGQLAGEATPRYAVMSARRRAQLKRLVPEVKLIYLLRDPIDRMWSDLALFSSAKFGGAGIEPHEQVRARRFLTHPANLAHSCYARNLRHWESVFSREKIHIAFYDDIVSRPEGLVTEVCEFLGVDPLRLDPGRLLRERIHSHEYPPIPPSIARMLAGELLADLRDLDADLQHPYTARWVERAENLIQTPA